MKTIVIVEDEFRIRQGLGDLINKIDMGCQVIGASENGYEGQKMIRDLEPDIVITDIQMPKMDGLTMIKKVKEMGAECKFVILSGHAEFDYARQAISLGIEEFLLKPATISDVKILLTKLVTPDKTISNTDEGNEYSKVVTNMLQIMKTNYGMRLVLDTFSEKYHLTPEHISNLFAKETGSTFSNYLRKIRMEKAKELILTTNLKIYEVACRVGYPDPKYFSKVFKEYTGVSAKQFIIDKN